jgi:hypothetical protein
MKKLSLIILVLISTSICGQPQMKMVDKGDTVVHKRTMHHHKRVIDSTSKLVHNIKDTVIVQDSIIKKQKDIIDKSELSKNILGNMSLTFLVSIYIFALMGMFLRWGRNTAKAIKNDETTPNKFSFKYWIINNLFPKIRNMLLTLVALFAIFRFIGELYNMVLTLSLAFAIGLTFDYFFDKLMSFDVKTIIGSLSKSK